MTRLEQLFKEAMETVPGFNGPLRTIRNGWPDFLVVDNGHVVLAAEVKERYDQPTSAQEEVHSLLRLCGLDVRVVHEWDIPKLVAELKGADIRRVKRMLRVRDAIAMMPSRGAP